MMAHNIRGERTVIGEHKFSLTNDSFLSSFADAMGATTNNEIVQMKDALAPIVLCCAVSALGTTTSDTEWRPPTLFAVKLCTRYHTDQCFHQSFQSCACIDAVKMF